MLKKGSIYKLLYNGAGKTNRKTKERNKRVIKKFLMTSYFIARKNWAIRENFSDFVYFLKRLGDDDIEKHLIESSTHATYASTSSTDEFIKCLSEGGRISKSSCSCYRLQFNGG